MKFIDFWHENRKNYQAVLFDIDGTILAGGAALPGAAAVLAELRRDRFPHYILTNDANHSTEEKSRLLRRGGLEIAPDEIISCGAALDELVEERNWQGKTFFVLGLLGNPCFAERAGLLTTRDESRIESCHGILNGEDYYDWHNHMQTVLNFFRRHPDRPLVVPNPDSYWPGHRGDIGIGAGGQARFLCGLLAEMGIRIDPIYLGKPYRPIYDHAIHLLKKRFPQLGEPDYGKILMVGDSLRSDIRGANNCGMDSALVLTGITQEAEIAAAPADCRPKHVFATLG
jgi:NagD protein